MHRVVAIVALLLQTGFALLGSGGLHALPGHHCSHVHPPAATPGSGGHAHGHCGHHHHHAHHESSPAQNGPAEPRPFEPVDDDCEICRLFVLGATVAPPVVLEGSTPAVCAAAPLWTPLLVETLTSGPVTTRGPPQA